MPTDDKGNYAALARLGRSIAYIAVLARVAGAGSAYTADWSTLDQAIKLAFTAPKAVTPAGICLSPWRAFCRHGQSERARKSTPIAEIARRSLENCGHPQPKIPVTIDRRRLLPQALRVAPLEAQLAAGGTHSRRCGRAGCEVPR